MMVLGVFLLLLQMLNACYWTWRSVFDASWLGLVAALFFAFAGMNAINIYRLWRNNNGHRDNQDYNAPTVASRYSHALFAAPFAILTVTSTNPTPQTAPGGSAYPSIGDIEELPDDGKPLFGYKMLKKTEGGPEDGLFLSLQMGNKWVNNELYAACAIHEAPQLSCSCGIYAMKSIWQAGKMFHVVAGHLEAYQTAVVVQVKLGGRIYGGESGYRAQYAQITGYWWKDKWVTVDDP